MKEVNLKPHFDRTEYWKKKETANTHRERETKNGNEFIFQKIINQTNQNHQKKWYIMLRLFCRCYSSFFSSCCSKSWSDGNWDWNWDGGIANLSREFKDFSISVFVQNKGVETINS